MLEKELSETVEFMNKKGMLHFDAHFRNILTDGKHIYFSDFGLATHSGFALTKDERMFFVRHKDYDRSYVAGALVEFIINAVWNIKSLPEQDQERIVDQVIEEYATRGKVPHPPKSLSHFNETILVKYAPVAKIMSDFLGNLPRNAKKKTPFPHLILEKLWKLIE